MKKSKSENDFSHKVTRAIRKLDPVLVENLQKPGTPDINYVEGWLELKYLPDWPKRAETTVKFPKFYPQQRVWLVKRTLGNGNCFVFVQIRFTYLLFQGGFAAQHFDRMTKAEMLRSALYVWDHFPEMELPECLK